MLKLICASWPASASTTALMSAWVGGWGCNGDKMLIGALADTEEVDVS